MFYDDLSFKSFFIDSGGKELFRIVSIQKTIQSTSLYLCLSSWSSASGWHRARRVRITGSALTRVIASEAQRARQSPTSKNGRLKRRRGGCHTAGKAPGDSQRQVWGWQRSFGM